MKQINSIEELKKESSNNNGEYAEFFIVLNFGLRSSKRILYNDEVGTFNIINEIDDSYQDGLTEAQLAKETLIMEAIDKGSFFRYNL